MRKPFKLQKLLEKLNLILTILHHLFYLQDEAEGINPVISLLEDELKQAEQDDNDLLRNQWNAKYEVNSITQLSLDNIKPISAIKTHPKSRLELSI